MNADIFSSYRKSIKVIQSSLNQDHIKSSRTYINLFFKLYSSPIPQKSLKFEIVEASTLVGEMYGKLCFKLEEKKESLKKL